MVEPQRKQISDAFKQSQHPQIKRKHKMRASASQISSSDHPTDTNTLDHRWSEGLSLKEWVILVTSYTLTKVSYHSMKINCYYTRTESL